MWFTRIRTVAESILNEVDIDRDTVVRIGLDQNGAFFKTNKIESLSPFKKWIMKTILHNFILVSFFVLVSNFYISCKLLASLILGRKPLQVRKNIMICSNPHSLSN